MQSVPFETSTFLQVCHEFLFKFLKVTTSFVQADYVGGSALTASLHGTSMSAEHRLGFLGTDRSATYSGIASTHVSNPPSLTA